LEASRSQPIEAHLLLTSLELLLTSSVAIQKPLVVFLQALFTSIMRSIKRWALPSNLSILGFFLSIIRSVLTL